MNTKVKFIVAAIATALLGTGAIAMTQDQPTPTQQVLATPEASPAPVATPDVAPTPDVAAPQATPVPTVVPITPVVPTANPVVAPATPIPQLAKPTPRPVSNGDGSVYIDDTLNDLPAILFPMPTPRVTPTP